ncbi:Rgg/GadR/MutR family transcriptional regulator [Liquorilactobacillus mali]|uniref:Rgg/GadR/MutR family transcriptional regulator n=1 Tax=Liquorilactobacillus mali TaxID=1618 RepID=UPI0029554792|nr:helix-turn-helix domain-containing protein [Liquorilactobacillus mali]
MKIGKVFKYFRQTKHITLKEACQGIVSVPFLSRFENGLTDISFSHLLELLNRINVQLSEFEFLYQQKNTTNNDLLPAFQQAYQEGNAAQLKRYLSEWQKKQGKFANLQTIQLKMMLTTLGEGTVTEDELAILVSYFQKIDNWTFFELYLFGHAISFLELPIMLNLFKELQKKEIIYDDFRHDNFSILFYIYNNVILHLLANNYFNKAHTLVNHLENYFGNHDKDYYHQARLFNLKGLTLYLMDQKVPGLRLLKKANLITYLTNHKTDFLKNEKNYLAKYLSTEELGEVFNFSEVDYLK